MESPREATPGTTRRTRLGIAFFALYLIATNYPGVLLFNRIEPRIAGLPLVLVWFCGWIVAAGLVLWRLERAARI